MDRDSSRLAKDAGPGAWLRQAREDRGLSAEDVGRSLNLSLRRIEALEDDDYEKLPGPTYVRGYLRGYALLLGLEPQPLLDAFNRLPVAAQRNDMVAPAPVQEVTSSDAMVKVGTVLILGLVIGLAALWWGGKDGSNSRRRQAATAAVAPGSPAVTSAAETAGAEAMTPTLSTEERPMPVKAVEPVAPPTAPERRPPAVTPVVATTQSPVINTAPIDPGAPRVQLVLQASEDSWADVRDAEDRRLIYQTIAGGRVMKVEGVPPLSVFLGNVDGVRVEFNGQPYDAQRHKRGPLARFTLGANDTR